MRQDKHPNNYVRNRLVTTAVIAATALASTVQTANAQPTGNAKGSPAAANVAPLTPADQELNLRVQQKVGALARHIAQLAARQSDNKPGHEPDIQGNTLAVTTVKIPVRASHGNGKAAYNLSFTAPETANGEPQPDKVVFLTMSAGDDGEPKAPRAPKILLGFQINPATGAWGASVDSSNSFTQPFVSGIDPVSPTVPNMTLRQLNTLFDLGMSIIDGAEHGDNPSKYVLPSTLNQSTTPLSTPGSSNGGTSIPPEASMPSGGVPAP